MKIAFLIHSLEVSGCRYRVLQYLPYFEKEGMDVSIHFFKGKWFDRLKDYNSLGQWDLLYFHRKLLPPPEFWYLRRKARRIIFDFDDAIMYRSSTSKNPYSSSRRLKFAYMIKRVDFVIAGNEFLKSEVLPYNGKVEVIPTSIDLSQYQTKDDYHAGDLVTIGWLGSSSTLKYLKFLMPTLEKVYQKHPHLQLKIVCDQFVESSKIPVIKKRWSEEDEKADLKSFDIGVMPLEDDLWSRGKCGLKILQYYGVGLPVVCTPVGVNRDIVKDGVNGFWAENGEEWEARLSRLIQDENLRKEMGLRGRKIVEQGYSLDVNGSRIVEIFKKLLGGEKWD
jgi:glycosyltransferase involved in cell wall biosynthesis